MEGREDKARTIITSLATSRRTQSAGYYNAGYLLPGPKNVIIGDDDNSMFTMHSLPTSVSWLGSHTESVIAAMADVCWCNWIYKPEPHLLLRRQSRIFGLGFEQDLFRRCFKEKASVIRRVNDMSYLLPSYSLKRQSVHEAQLQTTYSSSSSSHQSEAPIHLARNQRTSMLLSSMI
ncbi:hypothetical protein Tco_0738854 [Tanacetum coccineum]